ncbi:BRO-N domain-containing protein, partial [Pseudomonas antarctica]|uniref:BRO-N domain-containing protein n=1 Tax=Pseudomonas antarctica TaxID=219572 RepID=UPI00387AC542
MATTMQFEKRNFMGVELDVLTGHPDHDLLFVATQVARAAGLKFPSQAVSQFRRASLEPTQLLSLETLVVNKAMSLPRDQLGRALRGSTPVMAEGQVYQMLLRGHAPASEPFRKWVTEEVLPTIRKTGKYNAEESTNPIAIGVMDELKTLRSEVGELKSLIEILMARPVA